jgi:folate-binding protein YgfZ
VRRAAGDDIGGMEQIARLAGRGVVAVTGEDRVGFLQGLVSNDVAAVAPGRAVWAALLSPQGKYLADFFVFAGPEGFLLDCEAGQVPLVVQRLGRFRLRAQVAVGDVSGDWAVYAAWPDLPALPEGVVAAADPRLAAAGFRVLSGVGLATNAEVADWDRHRLGLGLPDGSRDLEADKTVLLEAGFDELNGVSWSKGCYMGQELTARTRYRGLIKRRLVPVEFAGARAAAGTPVFAEGREVGVLRDGQGAVALASLRVDALAAALECDGVALRVMVPKWMRLPEAG